MSVNARVQTVQLERVGERTTPRLTATFVDESDVAIASLASLFLTIHCNGAEVKARTDVLSSFSAGTLTLYLTEAETRILGSDTEERHTALLEWTWGSGPVKSGNKELVYFVKNFTLIPA